MKILHVLNISFVIPFFLGEQLNWFAEKGYKEHIICSDSDELAVFSRQYGFKYKAIEILRKISVGKDLKAVYLTYRYIRKIKADVVCGHTPKGGLIAMLAAYLARVPIRLYFRHGLVYETSTGLKRRLLVNIDRLASRLATKIVCVSPSVANKSIEDRLNPSHKQVLLGNGTCNGIDVQRFHKSRIKSTDVNELKQKLGIEDGDFVIGFTGRLVRDKGIIELVQAYNKLQRHLPNIRLLLVGMLETRDALPADIVKAIQESNIICTGYVHNTIIERYYALMDVLVLPSYREGFPTSVLEASSMEIPIITTRATGCRDSIVEGVTGLFVDHSARGIEQAVLELYHDASLRERMGKSGREFVVEHFEQHLVWEEIEKIYN